MSLLNYRALSVSAMLLLAGGSAMAQSDKVADREQTIRAQDPATYAADETENQLPWPGILMSDIAFRKRVWREIDATDANNKIFSTDMNGANKNELINILVDGILTGKIKAYDANTPGRFTKQLSKEELMAIIAPGGSNGNGFNPEQVTKYAIKEDWLFVKKDNKFVVRIVGITPIREVVGADGKKADQELCAIYYPYIRDYLATQKVQTGKGFENMTWDDVFQDRKFSSRITKVSSGVEPLQATNAISK